MFHRALLLLSATAAALLATAQQCPGDTTGCYMCPGSRLMQCLNAASAATDACLQMSMDEQPQCLCAAYTFGADCWAAGTFCLEWRPNAIAAEQMCVFAASLNSTNTTASASLVPSASASESASEAPAALPTPTEFPTSSLSSLIIQQSQVTSSIWHDDSGTDIPSLSQDSTHAFVPTATRLQDAFATAMSALPESASSGAPYAGPSVVVASNGEVVTATGSGVTVSGGAATGSAGASDTVESGAPRATQASSAGVMKKSFGVAFGAFLLTLVCD